MSQTIEQLKTEVSEEYLKQFKKELWWMKSLTLLPIEKKVKEIILWQRELPASFDEVQEFGRRKDIIGFLTPSTSNEIFNFMKEKRLLLEQKNTEEELNNLKHEVLTGEILPLAPVVDDPEAQNTQDQKQDESTTQDKSTNISNSWNHIQTDSEENLTEKSEDKEIVEQNNNHSIEKWAIVSTLWVWLGIQGAVENKKYTNKIVENIETKKMRTTMESTLELMKWELSNPRYTALQKANISKNLKEFESGLDAFNDNTIGLLKQRGALWNKLPNSVLKNIHIDSKTLNQLKGIETELVGKSLPEMKKILATKSIANIPDDVLNVLKNADNVGELKAMTNILSNASEMRRVSKMIKGMFAIDVLFLWVDVWMYFETMSEAEAINKINSLRAQNKISQANTQLVIALSSFAAELGIVVAAAQIGAIWWPLGILVWLVVGAISAAVSHGVDVLYYDVQDFYKQNKEDYIRQSKTKLKQSILQHLHNKKFGNISLNEQIGAPSSSQKKKTLRDSLQSLVFLEELEIWTYEEVGLLLEYKQSTKSKTKFVSWLSEDNKKKFREQDNRMNKKIEKRMEYIAKHYNDKEYVDKLKASRGLSYLSQFIVDSWTYVVLKKAWKWDDNISLDSNRESYVNKEISTLPQEIKNNLDILYNTQPKLFSEISYGAKIYLNTALNTDDLSEENSSLKSKIQYILTYQQAKEFGKYNNKKKEYTNYSNISYDYITRIIQNNYDVHGIAPTRIERNEVKKVFWYANERTEIVSTSPSLKQNIIYRLATELYDYQWENDMMQLIGHFSSSNANTYGLYYDDGWYINNDYEIDQKLEFGNLDNKELSEKVLAKEVKKIINSNFYSPMSLTWWPVDLAANYLWILPLQRKSIIDTPTETIDTNLSQELEKKLSSIVYEECLYRTKEYKTKIKQSISDYIKKYAIDGKYIELPHYLVENAIKSGLWDLTSVLCTYRDNKLVMISPDHTHNIHIDDVVLEYIEPVRKNFSHSEQQYINEIEFSHKQLEKVRGITWTWSHQDDLDLPQEIEIEISKQYKERQQQKNRLLYISSDQAKVQLQNAHGKYTQYFNTIYRWIISSWHSFWNTNDIDSADLFGSVMMDHSKKWIDTKTGKLKKNKEWELLFAPRWVEFEKTYDKIFESYIYKWKKIENYLHSKNPEERKLWAWLSKTIVFTLLEISSLALDNNAEIESFNTTGTWIYLPMITDYKNDAISKQFYKRLEKNLSQTLNLNPIEIENQSVYHKQIEDLNIYTLTHRQKKTVDITHILQKKIEHTAQEVVRQGKRWNIVYDPINHTLESRNHKIKIIEWKNNTYKIGNYSEYLSLSSALWLANFANWYQYTYHKSDIEYRNWLTKYPPFRVKWLYSKNTWSLIMTPLLLMKNCPEINSEKDIWNFVYYINNKLKK